GDYWVDEKQKQVHLSEAGMEHADELLRGAGIILEGESLYDSKHLEVVHHLNAGLRAHALYSRDVDYIVRDGEVTIVDEFTGRTLSGRRWSDGLHQAVEAKEGVPIQRENQTLGSITFQNYFRLYKKLAGMTGTADTEAFEFQSIYGLEVVVIPTHRPMVRVDETDMIFLKAKNKFDAILEDIRDCYARQQPVLVGTTSIETSEYLGKLLDEADIPHEVLNAKQHEREAHIVANAGRPGAITIATNMAGRGTDIVLGGSLEAELAALPEDAGEAQRKQVEVDWKARHDSVRDNGGLRIIGTERHESRRIDNQLRGRSGRQGDPGSTRFYLSLEDSLLRIFMGERVAGLMRMFGMKEEDAIQDRMVTKQIMNAQRKVEAQNFDFRKHLLEFDDTANDQRKVIYEQRNELLDADGVDETVAKIREDVIAELVQRFVPANSIDEQWQIPALQSELASEYGLQLDIQGWLEDQAEADADSVLRYVDEAAARLFREKEALLGSEAMRQLERHVMLSVIDNCWKEHLTRMDYLRQGIYLRGYAQKQPKQEFQRESFLLFEQMLNRIKHEMIQLLARVHIRSEEEVAEMEALQRAQAAAQAQSMSFQHAQPAGYGSEEQLEDEQPRQAIPAHRDAAKVGRNDPCPCGSGKKYKHCHGALN
ncbi:MAG: preprotein translocase subunit SecA, partial [Dokdonella sp.]